MLCYIYESIIFVCIKFATNILSMKEEQQASLCETYTHQSKCTSQKRVYDIQNADT